jgi:UbiD family decarboxylase
MKFRELLSRLDGKGELIHVKKKVSREYEMAAVIKAFGEKPIIFENVEGSKYKAVAGLCASRELFAGALGTTKEKLIFKMTKAMDSSVEPPIYSNGTAPCQEVVEDAVGLDSLPILRHFESDGGRYIPSAVAIINDPDTGHNACYHRLMQIGKDRFAARLVEKRQTDTSLKKMLAQGKDLEIAFCIGNSSAVMLAASMSPASGVNEIAIANALDETPVVKCETKNILVPADCEIVLEGRITAELADEGPFVDLTETNDIIRKQPVIVIDKITRRKDAIYQTLLPGLSEHKLLMGMPREPTMFKEVSKACECTNVALTLGGSCWSHGVVQIRKKSNDEPAKAIEAAFRGHGSMKQVIVVDEDIDITNPLEVEWAVATRFRADKRLKIFENQPASSLDPMADKPPGQKATVAKMGLDATIPLDDPARPAKKFKKVAYRQVQAKDYL